MSNIIEQSKNRIEQLLGISYEEAIDDVQTLISEKLNEEEINVAITGVEFTGSQRFGNPNKDSDLDVVFTYESIDERVKEDYLFNILNKEPIYYYGFKLDINPIEDGNIDSYILNASKYKKELAENLQPFELEAEKDRIRDVLDIMKDVEYGFISQVDGKKITDRDWIHHCDLDRYYKVNTDPLKTIKDKLGICQDQSIAVKYLMNKLHPEDTVKLFTMTKSPIGHCVPCYCHNDKWYYIENSWDKEKGLHGYFESEDELKKYLKFIYFENHKDDTPKDSKVEVGKYTMPLTEDTRSQLTAASRNAGPYKGDTTRGKNRFERKKWSKVANQVRSYNQIDMNDFFKKDQLDIKIPVTGETKEYTVTLRLNGVCAEIAKNIKSNGNKFEYKTVVQALTKIFNTANVYVNCTCADFCLTPETAIKLLDGRVITVAELAEEIKNSAEDVYLYSVDENGDFKPGKIKDVWCSGQADELIEVTLDNGKTIRTTKEHPYMLRTGEYLPANELKVGQSLMPLYFSQTENGYETVKLNSKPGAQFFSTYKLVANELLQKEQEEAKLRSGEETIAIHHKDFIKTNNSPLNLAPMGVVEHWLYHCKHAIESGAFAKFKAGGEAYRKLVMDRSNQEYKKQAKVMSQAISHYWATISEEESARQTEMRSINSKAAWASGAFKTEARQKADEQRKLTLHTAEMEALAAEGVRQYWAKLSEAERTEVIAQRTKNLAKGSGWNKGKHLSETDKLKKSEAALNKSPEEKAIHNLKIRDAKILKVFKKLLTDQKELSLENYEQYRSQFFNNSPRLTKYFSTIEEATSYFQLNHKIIAIKEIKLDEPIPVYDIAVENYHNFFVDAGVILHNCYRFNHWSVVNNYGTTDSAHDPGPGKGIANPANDKGKGCKHVLLTIANMDWLMKVASVIHNYINYIAEHKQAAFNQIIFPKLYGIPVDAAKENNLVPEETNLDTDKNLINTINDWAKNRGKIKPGTRVNPVTGTGGRAKAATPTTTTAKPAATTPTKPAATTPAAGTKPTNAQPKKEETK